MPIKQTPFRLGDDTLAELADLAASNGGNLTTAVKEAAAQFRAAVEEAARLNAEEISAEDWVRLAHLNDPDPFSGLDLDDDTLPSRHGVDWSAALAAELLGMWEGRDSSHPLHREEAKACRDLARRVARLGRVRGYALTAALRYFWRHPEAGVAACRAVEVWLTPTAKGGDRARLRLGDTVVWVTIEDRSAGRTGVLIEAPEDVAINRNEILPPGEQRREPRRRA